MHFKIFLTEFIFFLFGKRMLASERVGMSKLILDPLPFFLSAAHAVYFIVFPRSSFNLKILHFLLLLKFCNLFSPLRILHLELIGSSRFWKCSWDTSIISVLPPCLWLPRVILHNWDLICFREFRFNTGRDYWE